MKISTPGRICLFGEHLDYLGLPVIAAAISRRINLNGSQRTDRQIVINLPDIQSKEVFELAAELTYTKERDYLKSSVNVLLREGFAFSSGFDIEVHGNIPINSGTSSSSALIVAWITFLAKMADHPVDLTAEQIGKLANKAEVLEFGEPGGMMDHYSTAIGNVIYLESEPEISVKTLVPRFGAFVLGDSQEPKDTIGIIKRVKFGMLDVVKKIRQVNPAFSLKNATILDTHEYKDFLTKDEMLLLRGTLHNIEILFQAKKVLEQPELDHQLFGKLLNEHQTHLRAAQQISTPKIDKMLESALQAGALGGKINGSGGGGCMFVYAPENPEKVAESIESAGGKAYIIHIDDGTRVEL